MVLRFIHAHSHLQSRSTTQPEDLPLILVNLSGLNANYISRIWDTDERMRLFIYALGSVPVELLYSNCGRIGGDAIQVDGWIPCEVAAEKFSGEHLLHLGQEGFTFRRSEDSPPYEFFLLTPPYPRTARFSISCHDKRTEEKMDFRVEALSTRTHKSPTRSEGKVYILIDRYLRPNHPRGAQFLVTRIDNEKVFLQYIRPLRLWKTNDIQLSSTMEENLEDRCFILPAAPQQKFILERSSSPQASGFPRPQNPDQYFPRLDVIIFNVCPAIQLYISSFTWVLWNRLFKNGKIATAAFLLEASSYPWLFEWALRSMSHRAWIATYGRSWTPHGPWKWFWRCMNFQSPISYKAYAKALATFSFIACVLTNNYWGMLSVSIYWLPLFERKQLGLLYLWALLFKAL